MDEGFAWADESNGVVGTPREVSRVYIQQQSLFVPDSRGMPPNLPNICRDHMADKQDGQW